MYVGWDIETTRLRPWFEDSRIWTMAASVDHGNVQASWACTVAPEHPDSPEGNRQARWAIERLLVNPEVTLVGQNVVGFDAPWWDFLNPEKRIRARFFDTAVAYSLIDENADDNSLAGLTRRYLGETLDEEMKANRKRITEQPLKRVLEYNAKDAEVGLRLVPALTHDLKREGLWSTFERLMVAAPVVVRMMTRGMRVDVEEARRTEREYQRRRSQLEMDMNLMVGRRPDLPPEFRGEGQEPINFASHPQVRDLLYEELQIPPSRDTPRTGKGALATSESALKELRSRCREKQIRRFLDLMLEHRGVSKMLSTYLGPFTGKWLGRDGRVHTFYSLGRLEDERRGKGAGTVTGRMASSSPNLQNIPRKSAMKRIFIPGTGWRLFEVDYSQIELLLLAWYARETAVLRALQEGRDVHVLLLSEIEGRDFAEVQALVDSDPVWEKKRTSVKRVQYGITYGASAWKIRQLLRDEYGMAVSQRRVQTIMEQWRSLRPRTVEWIKRVEGFALENAYVRLPTGRIRHLDKLHQAPTRGEEQHLLRQAVNFMVQGLAADVMREALVALERRFEFQGLGAAVQNITVHDSVVGEYRPYDLSSNDLRRIIRGALVKDVNQALMAEGLGRRLPLKVDVKTNLKRWGV